MKRLIYTSLIMTFLFILVAGGAWAAKGGEPGKPPGGNGEESNYKVTDLGTLDGGKKSSSVARDINFDGQVVGWSNDGQQTLATLWTVSADGGSVDVLPLGTPDGQTSSEAYAINQAGTMVAGHAGTIEYPVPVYWDLSNSSIPKLLDPLLDFIYGVAYDVNDEEEIAGMSIRFEGELPVYSATLWDENPEPTELPSLLDPKGGNSSARGINNQGDVVGMSWVWVDVDGEGHYLTHAVLWRDTGVGYEVCDLHVWDYADSHHSRAYAITDRDPTNGSVEITGHRSLFSAGTPLATVWTVNLNCEDMDTRDLSLPAYAWDINDAGEVVGQDHSRSFARPVVWVDNQMVVLPSLKRDLGSAEGINDGGQIVGWSKAGGRKHGVLWTKKDQTP